MTPLVERTRNAGLALAIVAVTVGVVLGTAWLAGMTERAGRVGALERQLRTRPTVSVTVTHPAGAKTPPLSPPVTAPGGSQPPQTQPAPVLAAAPPPAVSALSPAPSGGSRTPQPPKRSPSPTPSPPVARACTVRANGGPVYACVIAAATVKAASVP